MNKWLKKEAVEDHTDDDYPFDNYNFSEEPTLRDRFAMAALATLTYTGDRLSVAKNAYDIADAMLSEREKDETQH